MKLPDGLCPCNSGKSVSECCYQLRPPVDRDSGVRINGVRGKTTMQIYNDFGMPMTPRLPANAKLTMRASDVIEPDDFIYRMVRRAKHDVGVRLYTQPLTKQTQISVSYEETLVSSLYRNIRATFYHLQGFIFRYTRLSQKFEQNPIKVGRGITLVEDDLPLELEFEAFMIRYRTCVELAVKLIASKAMNRDSRRREYDFKKTLEYIQKHPNTPMRMSLAEVINTHQRWIEQQRLIRHAIAHDGMNDVLASFEHITGVTLNATVLDRTANVMCTQMFNELMDFCGRVLTAIYGNDAEHPNPDETAMGSEGDGST